VADAFFGRGKIVVLGIGRDHSRETQIAEMHEGLPQAKGLNISPPPRRVGNQEDRLPCWGPLFSCFRSRLERGRLGNREVFFFFSFLFPQPIFLIALYTFFPFFHRSKHCSKIIEFYQKRK